jgi:hypothetical protein
MEGLQNFWKESRIRMEGKQRKKGRKAKPGGRKTEAAFQ